LTAPALIAQAEGICCNSDQASANGVCVAWPKRSPVLVHHHGAMPSCAHCTLHPDFSRTDAGPRGHTRALDKTPTSTHVSNCDALSHTGGTAPNGRSTEGGSEAQSRDPWSWGSNLVLYRSPECMRCFIGCLPRIMDSMQYHMINEVKNKRMMK
jgi:hypothetical protein